MKTLKQELFNFVYCPPLGWIKINIIIYRFQYDDVGMINITDTCPADIGPLGKTKFRVRGIFEYVKYWVKLGQLGPWWNKMAQLGAMAKFSNGTIWKSEFNITTSDAKLTTETTPYSNCTKGWHTLPSGKVICYIEALMNNDERKEYCGQMDAYEVEITSREDAQAFMYSMFKIAKLDQSSFAIGAKAKLVEDKYIWVWEHNGHEVLWNELDFFSGISPNSNDVAPAERQSLYMDIVNAPASDDQYLDTSPRFALNVKTGPSTNATHFICMKDGEGSVGNALKVFVTSLDADIHVNDVAGLLYNLKTPHRRQFPFELELTPDPNMRICKMMLSHVGRNFPCLKDPIFQYDSQIDTSFGLPAKVNLGMVANWGKFLYFIFITLHVHCTGSGPMDFDTILDSDSIQISVFVDVKSPGQDRNMNISHYITTSNQSEVVIISGASPNLMFHDTMVTTYIIFNIQIIFTML